MPLHPEVMRFLSAAMALSACVRDGIIQQVGPSSGVSIPAGATHMEAGGKYLMPGLADMHVHMVGPRQLQEDLLKMYVVTGVTTILNMRGTPDHLAMRADSGYGGTVLRTTLPPEAATRFQKLMAPEPRF